MKDIGIKNIITGIFVFAAIVAFMVFSGVIKIGNNANQAFGQVTVWGTIPFQTIQRYIDQSKEQNLTINYIEKRENNYESELVNAFASGTGPDLFIMSHEGILRHSDKILEIPFESFPKADYEATYIDQSRLFLTDSGVKAFPIAVDPMVMYYNKALISSAFILDIPEYWDDFASFTSQVTKYSGTGEVIISSAALGTFDNIPNAKNIITSLIIQNRNDIINTDTSTQKKRSVLSFSEDEIQKTSQALDFYTSFARFGSNTYSWNEALVDAKNKFISGDLAIYFGPGSEAGDIRRKNPNLDFAVTLFPQVRDNTTRSTHGAMTGIAIAKQSKNIPAAINVASKIAGSVIANGLATDLNIAPARKDLLRDTPEDALRTLIYNSAIISRGWLDADPQATNLVFRELVRNINSGALSTRDAIGRANADLNTILNRTINTTIGN
jgi:ABC-type glycerol-3-phosphate transport system substrate-binding protein